MMNLSKTTLLLIFLIIFLILAGFFAYQWWQVKGELVEKIEENEDLARQVEMLKKEVEELKIMQIEDEAIKEEKTEVIITTDKREYKQGEVVKITVKNLNKSIWYVDFNCYPWWNLEIQKNKSRVSIKPLLPIGEECIACPPPESIMDVLKELKPNSEITRNWDLKYCKESIPSFVDPGNYRLTFAYGLTKDSYNEKTVYSNEFVIK